MTLTTDMIPRQDLIRIRIPYVWLHKSPFTGTVFI